jgi:hypothetical protein
MFRSRLYATHLGRTLWRVLMFLDLKHDLRLDPIVFDRYRYTVHTPFHRPPWLHTGAAKTTYVVVVAVLQKSQHCNIIVVVHRKVEVERINRSLEFHGSPNILS